MKLARRLLPHFVWLCVALFAVRATSIYSRIEQQMGMLIISRDMYVNKSGSVLHDARISVIFNSNRNCLLETKKSAMGAIAYCLAENVNYPHKNSIRRILDDSRVGSSETQESSE